MLGLTGGVDSLEGNVGGNAGASSRVRVVADYYGPTNLPAMGPGHMTPAAAEAKLIGCAVPACPDKAVAASPITYVSPGDPPFIILHGTADGNVPYSQSVELDSALRGAGVPVALRPVHGAGHGGAEFTADSNLARVHLFFRQALGLDVVSLAPQERARARPAATSLTLARGVDARGRRLPEKPHTPALR
jgi:acetyl esterase/lipase